MHLQQQRIRSPDEFQLTDVNTVKHDSKHQRPSFRFIHIASEQPIHIVGIRTLAALRRWSAWAMFRQSVTC